MDRATPERWISAAITALASPPSELCARRDASAAAVSPSLTQCALELAAREIRDPVVDGVARDGALSHAMARWGLLTTWLAYAPRSFDALSLSRDLAGRTVAVVLAESVPTAPFRPLALPLLRGAARVIVRPPRAQPWFTAAAAEQLVAAAGAPCVVCVPEPDARAFVRDALHAGADAVFAFGSDDAVRAIGAALPAGVHYEGRGHGVGVAFATRESLGDDAALDALALDVVAYDQRGCLSPQTLFVEGSPAAAAHVGARLHDALSRLGDVLARGPVEPPLASAITQWRGATAAASTVFHRGVAHSVAVLERPALASSPGARNIAIVPVASLDEGAALLAPLAHFLTTVGVAGSLDRVRRDGLPAGHTARVVEAGTMQAPPLDGYEDPRPPLVTRG